MLKFTSLSLSVIITQPKQLASSPAETNKTVGAGAFESLSSVLLQTNMAENIYMAKPY